MQKIVLINHSAIIKVHLIEAPNFQTWKIKNSTNQQYIYRKDIEHFYHSFVYSSVSLLSGIYPLPAMYSLLVTLYVME